MCASSRMVIKRKGPDAGGNALHASSPRSRLQNGPNLEGKGRAIKLNHPYCAQFCVLGGASCTG